jgi:cytochrome c oxidase accessory protein FixG
MCPWPRFQSAMLDEDTMVVTYETWRGEPRGVRRKGDTAGVGDCVDCKQCVAVCPMGIDIRDGIQLECIGCGLCIDACNDVMAKVGHPPNLITYDTERRVADRSTGQSPSYRLMRPRTVLYVMLLLGIGGIMLYALVTRGTQGINVLQDRSMFIRLSDGSIRNGYEVKILNKERAARRFTLTVEGVPQARLRVLGQSGGPKKLVTLIAKPDDIRAFRVFVRAPAKGLKAGDNPIRFKLVDRKTGETTVRAVIFKAPGRSK